MYFLYYSFVFLYGSIWYTHKFVTDYICRFKSNLVHTLKINMPMLIQKRNKKHNMWGMNQRPLSPSIPTLGFEAQLINLIFKLFLKSD